MPTIANSLLPMAQMRMLHLCCKHVSAALAKSTCGPQVFSVLYLHGVLMALGLIDMLNQPAQTLPQHVCTAQ